MRVPTDTFLGFIFPNSTHYHQITHSQLFSSYPLCLRVKLNELFLLFQILTKQVYTKSSEDIYSVRE